MAYFNKLLQHPLGLALCASLLVHGWFLAATLGGTSNSGWPGAGRSGPRTLAPGLLVRLGPTTGARQPDALRTAARPRARAPTQAPGPTLARTTPRAASARALFEWFPANASATPEPSYADPAQAAFAAQQRQFRAMALLQARADIASQLAGQLDGSHECQQQPDQRIVCNTERDNALLTQWLDLTLQARRLGLSERDVELRGASGQLRLQLLG